MRQIFEGGVHPRRVHAGRDQEGRSIIQTVTQLGQYKRIVTAAGDLSAKVSCPSCGSVGDLTKKTIAPDGTVAEKLICPCGWSDQILLVNWSGSPATEGSVPTDQSSTPEAAGASGSIGPVSQAVTFS